MKIRIEILDDDGRESTSLEFAGDNVKERVIKFIDTLAETQPKPIESSPAHLHSGQNAQQPFSNQSPQPMQSQVVQQQQQQQQQFYPVSNMPVVQSVPPLYPSMSVPIQQAQYPQYYVPVNQQTVNTSVSPGVNQSVTYVPPQQQQQSGVYSPNAGMSFVGQQPVTEKQMSQVNNTPVPNVSLHDRIADTSLTISERLELFLKYEHPRDWSTSQKVQQHYESIYGEIKLSTVSTYLSRMYRKNLLERRGNRTQREYLYIGDMGEPVMQPATQPMQQGYPVWQMQR